MIIAGGTVSVLNTILVLWQLANQPQSAAT